MSRHASGPSPLPGHPDPSIRLGWTNDLVLEDLDSDEDEAYDVVSSSPVDLLPPVVPPPRVRTAMCAVTEEEHDIMATLPNVPIYDDYSNSQERVSVMHPLILTRRDIHIISYHCISDAQQLIYFIHRKRSRLLSRLAYTGNPVTSLS